MLEATIMCSEMHLLCLSEAQAAKFVNPGTILFIFSVTKGGVFGNSILRKQD